jgi:hypothetical protein
MVDLEYGPSDSVLGIRFLSSETALRPQGNAPIDECQSPHQRQGCNHLIVGLRRWCSRLLLQYEVLVQESIRVRPKDLLDGPGIRGPWSQI